MEAMRSARLQPSVGVQGGTQPRPLSAGARLALILCCTGRRLNCLSAGSITCFYVCHRNAQLMNQLIFRETAKAQRPVFVCQVSEVLSLLHRLAVLVLISLLLLFSLLKRQIGHIGFGVNSIVTF